MRTAEVQLDSIRARIGGALHELVPTLAGIDHQRSDHCAIRPTLFYFRNLTEVRFYRTITNQFDIVKARHTHGSEV